MKRVFNEDTKGQVAEAADTLEMQMHSNEM